MTLQERIRESLNYSPLTGALIWKKGTLRRVPIGSIAGGINKRDGYRYVRFEGRLYPATHLIFVIMRGDFPTVEIDHINRIRSDDRWANLRPATKSQNCCNKGLRTDNTSGIKGISWVDRLGKWKAEIRFQGHYRYLGIFPSKVAAQDARRSAAKKLHGEFSYEPSRCA
jgi:hypothetical protein